MKKFPFYIIATVCVLFMTSCWEDRSWQYYEKIQTKTWMYEVMQKNYLFYEDLPVLKKDDKIFFKQPNEFLRAVASKKDGKSGYIFSHVDSLANESRTMSAYPGFGYEAAFVNVRFETHLVPTLRVLYVQQNSPAEKSGMKRGDWIISVDNNSVRSEKMGEYTNMPTQSHEFTFGAINASTSGFDTLPNTKVLIPEPVDVKNILYDGVVETKGGRKAYYIMYNEFGDDETEWNALFRRMASATFDDVVVDLRYNPGGYLKTLQYMGSNLVPAEHLGKTFVELLPNADLELKSEQFSFDKSMLAGNAPMGYRNLYVIATVNSASASEAFINCMRPYVNHLYHVGSNTFGKNMAQSRYLDEKMAPGLEFWLTTYYVANKDKFYDYYAEGLKPDYLKEENFGGDLGELGTSSDLLLQSVLYHMDNGYFDSLPSDEIKSRSMQSAVQVDVCHSTISAKRKSLLVD